MTTALFERQRTGKGRLVEVAMQEAAYATLTSHLEAYWQSGNVPPRTGNRSHARSPLGVGVAYIKASNNTSHRLVNRSSKVSTVSAWEGGLVRPAF